MQRIIESGTGRNITSIKRGDDLSPDPEERRFVTFATESGSVHTVHVPLDHPAQTDEDLLAFYNATRTEVEHGAYSSLHDNTQAVHDNALKRMGVDE